jgi:hypothetical protein
MPHWSAQYGQCVSVGTRRAAAGSGDGRGEVAVIPSIVGSGSFTAASAVFRDGKLRFG